MKIISISGSGSGCGKTLLATLLLPILPGYAAVKVSPEGLYSLVTDDPETIGEAGKDTRRMKDAGAAHVVLVQGPPEGIFESLSMALNMCGDAPGVVIEGNAAARALTPGLSLFVLGPGLEIKPGAEGLLARADAVVVNVDSGEAPADAVEFVRARNKDARIFTMRQIREHGAEVICNSGSIIWRRG